MRYLVTMAEPDTVARWERLGEAGRAAVFEQFSAFTQAVAQRGELVAGEGLAGPAEARTLRPGPGRPVTEGPFAETTEQVGGFFLVDLPSMDDALDLARLLPEAYTIEVRPVSDGDV